MNIQKVNYITTNQSKIFTLKNRKTEENRSQKATVYSPFAYRDYNITFGDRLFRTPENFYEQEFNRENMPSTMSEYLFADYEGRKHIPPAQMMKIVYNDLNYAEKLEDAKELFPNEKLFENLQNIGNKKYREGILAEIRFLKEPDKSLFKNGKDDLGLYILKKIYLEGKTLKEINKDFKKDVSVVYAGISDINYRDLANLGIKYPKGPFWHSFYPTREDFPYVSLKRKDAEFHANNKTAKEITLSDINNGNIEGKSKPKYKPKDHEIKDITGAILEDFGDKEKTNKNLKRKLKSDDPKLLFIQKYMSEIMSISLDRVHASDEMRTFFEDYENIDKSARTRLKKYWENTPEMKALQGLVMSDTIKLFFEYYGADGNNELFKDLIDYAHSIKPDREEKLRIHNEKQQYYDELGQELATEESAQSPVVNNSETHTSSVDGTVFEEKDFKDKLVFVVDGKEYNVYSNLNEELTKCVNMNFEHLLPKAYSNKYAKYLCKTDLADDKFKLSIISKNSSRDYSIIDSLLYDKEKLAEITDKINDTFMRKNQIESRAAHQAFIDMLCKYAPDIVSEVGGHIYKATPLDIPVLASYLQGRFKDADDFLNERYNKYLAPLDNKEAKEIANKICKDIMKDYHKENSVFYDKVKNGQYGQLNEMFSIFFEDNMGYEQKTLRNHLQKFILFCGGSTRALLDDDLPHISKITFTEQLLNSFYDRNEDLLFEAYRTNPKTRHYILTMH